MAEQGLSDLTSQESKIEKVWLRKLQGELWYVVLWKDGTREIAQIDLRREKRHGKRANA